MRNPIITDQAIQLWNDGLCSMQNIADVFSVTRQAVKKYLNKHGIKTSKDQASRSITCSACGNIKLRLRCQRRINVKPYCSTACYHSALHNPTYIESRQGQRIARAIVRRLFSLQDTHIVHHEDTNTTNNDPSNLKVFACQGDHIRWHRLGRDKSGVMPLWSGIT